MTFKKAVRNQTRLRLALTGPSGAGKTYSALLLARGLGGKIALIDTERASASLYADAISFDTMDLHPPYSPERFVQAIEEAEQGGYDVLIIDSITHEWSGIGGCLELVDGVAKARYKGNSWSAWNEITPRHRAFLDRMMSCDMHIIATMRSKTETAQIDDNGRKKVVKLGMKPEQREGAEYEFSIVLDIVHDGHYATASKDRTGLFANVDPKPISEETGKVILGWLNSAQPHPVVQTRDEPTAPPRELGEEYILCIKHDIADAQTISALQTVHDVAMGVCKDHNDRAMATRIKSLIKARKAELEEVQ
jgi:hypothetical protein